MTRWEQRIAAPTVSFPQWSAQAPHRLFYVSDDDGSPQVWMLDQRTGERRRLTDQLVGVEELVVVPDGSGVAWWSDDTGDEEGAWVVTDAETGEVRPLLTGVPDGWNQGLGLGPGLAAVAVSAADSYTLWLQAEGDAAAHQLLEATYPLGLGREWETSPGGLSTDGALLCVRHAQRGDMLHFGLRVMSADPSAVVLGELFDAGLTLKEIGDHLGHRCPEATRIYTKVDLTALRLVALEDLGTLA